MRLINLSFNVEIRKNLMNWSTSAIVRQQVHWWRPFKVSGLISMNLLCCAQQEKVTAKNPPDFYLNKLKSYIDPVTSKSMKVAGLFDWFFSFEILYAVYVAGFSSRMSPLECEIYHPCIVHFRVPNYEPLWKHCDKSYIQFSWLTRVDQL